jgi:hypothetical protein
MVRIHSGLPFQTDDHLSIATAAMVSFQHFRHKFIRLFEAARDY